MVVFRAFIVLLLGVSGHLRIEQQGNKLQQHALVAQRNGLASAHSHLVGWTVVHASGLASARTDVAEAMLTISSSTRWLWIVLGLVLLCLLLPIITCVLAFMLGRAIKSAIESVDQEFLGVDVDIGKLTVDVLGGAISIEELTIHNPEGYHAPYLLHAKKVEVDIHMSTLIFSGFNHAVIEKLIFQDVDIIYCKKLTTSNVTEILAHLAGDAEKKPKDEAKPKDDDKAAPAKTKDAAAKTESNFKVTMQQVCIEKVGAKLAADVGIFGHGSDFGPRLAVADIHYEDFSKEVGEGAMAKTAAKIILKSVLKSAVATLLGQTAAQHIF